MSEVVAPVRIVDDGASVRHTLGNQIQSVRIKPSTGISPKRAEERIAVMESEVTELRLAQAEQSATARYKALICISTAVAAQREPDQLFSQLASELRQVVSYDFIGISQYDEATNKTQWHLTMPMVSIVDGRWSDSRAGADPMGVRASTTAGDSVSGARDSLPM